MDNDVGGSLRIVVGAADDSDSGEDSHHLLEVLLSLDWPRHCLKLWRWRWRHQQLLLEQQKEALYCQDALLAVD